MSYFLHYHCFQVTFVSLCFGFSLNFRYFLFLKFLGSLTVLVSIHLKEQDTTAVTRSSVCVGREQARGLESFSSGRLGSEPGFWLGYPPEVSRTFLWSSINFSKEPFFQLISYPGYGWQQSGKKMGKTKFTLCSVFSLAFSFLLCAGTSISREPSAEHTASLLPNCMAVWGWDLGKGGSHHSTDSEPTPLFLA